MSDLLSLLWGDFSAPGHFLSLNTQVPNTKGVDTYWFPLDAKEELLAALPRHYDKQVWFGVGTRPRDMGKGHRGNAVDVNAIPGMWIDLDHEEGKHAAEGLPSKARVEAFIASQELLMPNIVVDSGGGYQCYWVLDKPWTFNPGEHHAADNCLKAFESRARNLSAFGVDKVSDVARMMRMPGTFNNKRATPVPVTVVHTDPRRYMREEIIAWAGVAVDNNARVATQVPRVYEGPEPELVPFDKRKVLESLAVNKKNPALNKRVARGAVFTLGARDHEINTVAGTIAFIAVAALRMQATVDDVYSVMATSYEATAMSEEAAENPPPTESDVRRKISEAIKDAHRALRETLAEEAAADDAVARMRNGKGIYTREELKAVKKNRWIIASKGMYWTHFDGEYRTKPWPKDDLLVALHQELDIVPYIKWNRVTPTGGTVPRTAAEIVGMYGTVARDVRMSLVSQQTYYDEKDGTLVLATAPLAAVTPHFHAGVDQWLRLLGGDQQDIFLDWIASVTDHTTPSSAIYLQGPAGAGKTMLANGLARLWRSRSFTAFENTLKFNYGIAASPLIFADEHTPRSRETSITGVLRRYIANSMHHIEQKFMPVLELEGCVRVLLCANNGDLLADGNESNTREDVEAIAQRIVHIEATDAPGNFLKSIGGRAGTSDWVSGDVIAAHALWLKDNRQPKMGSRFLNEGKRTEFHTGMMSQGDASLTVVEALLRGVTKPTAGIVVGDGYVLVNAQVMLQEWENIAPMSARAPATVDKIGRVLRRYAHGRVQLRIGKTKNRYWSIDCSHIIPHGDRSGFDMQEFEKRLKAPLSAELREELRRNEKALTRLSDDV